MQRLVVPASSVASSGYDVHRPVASPAVAPSVNTQRVRHAVLWRPAPPGAASHGVPDLYWAPRGRCLPQGGLCFDWDDKHEFAYEAFNEGRDFGPLDIGRTVTYCLWIDALCKAHVGRPALVHSVRDDSPEQQANSVVCCCAYLILVQGMSAENAFRPFAEEVLIPFLDCRGEHVSGSAIADEPDVEFELTALDVLRGIERARDLGWLDYRTFNAQEHASLLRPENGDMSWLIPGKALALASPWAAPEDQDGLPVCTPGLLWSYFSRHGVNMIVQCNDPEREEEGERRRLLSYEPRSFDSIGIRHVRLAFEDGGCPSVELVLRFLEVVKANDGGYAVHCRSGLGRTATLIGVYAIQNFGFTARSFIGWARIMRPGTVHGSQQQYMVNLEPHARPGSPRPLPSLDQRERLRLLPRRELRFWALDSGIAPSRTRLLSDADIIELILQTHGLRVPMPAVPTRQPPPLRPPGTAHPVTYTHPANAVALTPQEQAQHLGVTSQAHPLSSAAAASLTSTGEVRTFGGASNGDAVTNAATLPPFGMTGLSSALASLSRGIGPLNANLLVDATPARSSLQKFGLAGALAAGGARGDGDSKSDFDEWEEVLRYVHLLAAVQADGEKSWESVQRRIERLRELCQHADQVGNATSASWGVEAAVEQVLEARRIAVEDVERHEAELERTLQEAHDLHRECDQLKQQLAVEREERESEHKRLEEQEEVTARELQKDEERLEGAVRQVEELRGRVLRQCTLEPWQVERVEQLRAQISEARESTSRYGAQIQEKRAWLENARKEQLRIVNADKVSEPEGAGRAPIVGNSTESAIQNFAEVADGRGQALAAALQHTRAAGMQDDNLQWDTARRSIEQLRDRFQVAVQQARKTISVS